MSSTQLHICIILLEHIYFTKNKYSNKITLNMKFYLQQCNTSESPNKIIEYQIMTI